MLKLQDPKLIPISIFAGVVLLLGSGISWWRVVYNSPSNVFDRMLATSLSTPAVSKHTTQINDSQKLDQTSVLMTVPQQVVHSSSVLGQTADPDTSITTESIGTPKIDFVRYTEIRTGQKNSEGNSFDFSSVIGTWGKADQNDPNSGGAQLFNQTLLGVVPMANVPQPARKQLLEQIKATGVYKIDMGSVRRQIVDGRPVYTYEVAVIPVAYVSLLKSFAHNLGLTQLEEVDPSAYQNSTPLNFTLDIDVWSGQLTKVLYEGSERTELYSAYGARLPIAIPTASIGVDELQIRLQQIR